MPRTHSPENGIVDSSLSFKPWSFLPCIHFSLFSGLQTHQPGPFPRILLPGPRKLSIAGAIKTDCPFPSDTLGSLTTLKPPFSSMWIVLYTLPCFPESTRFRSQDPTVSAAFACRVHSTQQALRTNSLVTGIPVAQCLFTSPDSPRHDSPHSLPRVFQTCPPPAPATSGAPQLSGECNLSPDQMGNPEKYLVGGMMGNSMTVLARSRAALSPGGEIGECFEG